MNQDFRIPYDRHYEELGRKTEALFQALRESIVNGTLPGGTRLPSSRKLAELYGLSRGSANAAYEMLVAEGFARTETGSGTFVEPLASAPKAPRQKGADAAIALSAWGERLVASRDRFGFVERHPLPPLGEGPISFRLRETDAELFPAEAWKSALHAEIREMTAAFPRIAAPAEGYLPLREAIAHELRRERGIRCGAENVCITNGSMQAIALLSMLLVRPGLPVVVENPGYAGFRRAVTAQGGTLLAAGVDDDGIVPEDWDAGLLLVTPTRQFPTGAVLSAKRRAALLAWASRRGAMIVEDDYDSELRWGGRPVEPLKALDREERVVYIGTFSKTMFVDLRIGYVVLPDALAEPFRLAKALLEPHPSALVEQRALSHFIGSGAYAKHVRRMKRTVGRRLLAFREAVEARLAPWFRFVPADAGLHMYAQWRGNPADYARLRAICAEKGVDWSFGDRLWEGDGERPCTALFGFAHLKESAIAAGGAAIEAACRELGGE